RLSRARPATSLSASSNPTVPGLSSSSGADRRNSPDPPMNFSFDFSGKRVLVTGGVSGIGRAVSLAFLGAGAEVIACGLTEQELEAARNDPMFGRIDIAKLDVTDRQAVDQLVGGLPSLDVEIGRAHV